MKRSREDIHNKCRELEQRRKNNFPVLLANKMGALSVWSFGHQAPQLFGSNSEMVDTLMASGKFDRDLYVTLSSYFSVDVRVLLEMCLS